MEYASGAAGGALGFIAGNLPGAVAGYKLGRMAYRKRYRSRSRSRSRGKITKYYKRTKALNVNALQKTPIPITGENDVSITYRRKRMPWRQRRNWKRFTRKVKAVTLKTHASKYWITRRTEDVLSVDGSQNATTIHTVMGLNGSKDFRDIRNLATLANAEDDDLQKLSGTKIAVKGWLAETQVYNNGDVTAYIDLYYWKSRKRVPAALPDLLTLWNDGINDLSTPTVLGVTGYNYTSYGVTPFQSPQFARTVRVWKKIRTKLSPGSVTQIETRSGKNYFRNFSVDEDHSMDTCTEGVLMVFYGVPSTVTDESRITTGVNLLFSTNVNYTYAVIKSNQGVGVMTTNPGILV